MSGNGSARSPRPASFTTTRTGVPTRSPPGCGTGHAVDLLAAAFPASEFTGYDLAADAIEKARGEAESFGHTNAAFEIRDVASLPAGPDGAGLGTCWGRELAERMLADAGLEVVSANDVPDDPVDLVYVSRRPA